MLLCLSVHLYVCKTMHTHAHKQSYSHTQTHTHPHTHTHTHTHTHMLKQLYEELENLKLVVAFVFVTLLIRLLSQVRLLPAVFFMLHSIILISRCLYISVLYISRCKCSPLNVYSCSLCRFVH